VHHVVLGKLLAVMGFLLAALTTTLWALGRPFGAVASLAVLVSIVGFNLLHLRSRTNRLVHNEGSEHGTTYNTIVQAWRDPSYREPLPADVRDALPEPPTDVRQLSDAELEQAAGAVTPGVAAGVFVLGGIGVQAADRVLDDQNGPG